MVFYIRSYILIYLTIVRHSFKNRRREITTTKLFRQELCTIICMPPLERVLTPERQRAAATLAGKPSQE